MANARISLVKRQIYPAFEAWALFHLIVPGLNRIRSRPLDGQVEPALGGGAQRDVTKGEVVARDEAFAPELALEDRDGSVGLGRRLLDHGGITLGFRSADELYDQWTNGGPEGRGVPVRPSVRAGALREVGR